MAFTRSWDETSPPGTAPAKTVATEIRNLRADVRERLESIFGITDLATQSDPIKVAMIRLTAAALTKIIGGSTGVAVRDTADANTNLYITDAGDVTVRKDLAVLGKILAAVFTGSVEVEAGESVTIRSPIQVIAAQGWVARTNKGGLSGAQTLDWAADGNNQAITLTGNTTLTFANPQAGAFYLIEVKQGGAGGYTITWPAGVYWPSGAAPVLTGTVARTDLVAFYYNGTGYLGMVISQDYNV